MLMIIREKTSAECLEDVAQDLKGYIKVVVDVQREILSAGGTMHVDGERLLLEVLNSETRQKVENITRSLLRG